MVDHVTRLLDRAQVVPAVNPIESHPYFAQADVQGVRGAARRPRSGVVADRRDHLLPRRRAHQHAAGFTAIAEAHGRSPAQVMLRWGLARPLGYPQSTKPHRIAENLDVFDFKLTADKLTAIDRPETGKSGGPEPNQISLESFGRDIPEA